MQQCQVFRGLKSQNSFQKEFWGYLVLVTSVVSLILLTSFVTEISSEEIVENEKGPYDCQRLMLRAGKRIMKVFSRCGREVKANCSTTREFADKMGCVMKCAMTYVNMLTDDYRITDESLRHLMEQFLPNEYMVHEVHTFLADLCRKAANKLDPTEDKCVTYAEYVVCLQSGFEEFMNVSPTCIKKKKKE